MARFDVYHRSGSDYLLDLQADFHDDLGHRVVVPLLPVLSAPRVVPGLQPVIWLDGEAFVMTTQYLASMPKRQLGPPVGAIPEYRDDILRALDLLFTGF